MACRLISKCLLIIFNVLFLVVGLFMVIVGCFALFAFNLLMGLLTSIGPIQRILELIQETGADTLVKNSAIYLLVIGAILLFVGVLGCGGAFCEQKCMLLTFLTFLVVVGLAAVGLIIYVAVDRDDFKTRVQSGLTGTLDRYAGTGLHYDTDGKLLAVNEDTDAAVFAWDLLQMQRECCGSTGYEDWSNIAWSPTYENVPSSGSVPNAKVPLSCCKNNDGAAFPARLDDITFTNPGACLTGTEAQINTVGCFDQVLGGASSFNTIVFGILGCIGGLSVIQIICCICLIRKPDEGQGGKMV